MVFSGIRNQTCFMMIMVPGWGFVNAHDEHEHTTDQRRSQYHTFPLSTQFQEDFTPLSHHGCSGMPRVR